MSDVLTALRSALADRYSIDREIGRGGMAVVYLAHDVKHERAVAVKVFRPELDLTRGADRFLREVKLTARLQHPHILPLYDSGEAGGFLFYVMPFVEGESLRDRLGREGRLPTTDALRIASEVAEALAYAHSKQTIHRDIKPGNILLSAGHAMVADFGIARAIRSAASDTLTETGAALGTPAYMSPEQILGEKAIDGRSDLYSLGCVLFEMLSGRLPFSSHDGQVVIARRFRSPPPTVRETCPAVSDGLATVLARTLAPEPSDRFQTSAAFVAALESERQSQESALRPVGLRHGNRRLAWNAPVRAGVIVAGIVLVAVPLFYVTRPRDQSGSLKADSVLPVRGIEAPAPARNAEAEQRAADSSVFVFIRDVVAAKDTTRIKQLYHLSSSADGRIRDAFIARIRSDRGLRILMPASPVRASVTGNRAVADVAIALKATRTADRDSIDRMKVHTDLVLTNDGWSVAGFHLTPVAQKDVATRVIRAGSIIVTAPPTAIILVGQRRVGAIGTWRADTLTPGSYEVAASVEADPACPTAVAKQQVTIIADSVSRVRLEPRPCGRLLFTSSVRDAQWTLVSLTTIDGAARRSGVVPADVLLPVGSYARTISSTRCQTYMDTVRAEPGRTDSLSRRSLFCAEPR